MRSEGQRPFEYERVKTVSTSDAGLKVFEGSFYCWELPREQSFHDSSPHEDHPLDDIDVPISGGMGEGLVRRLGNKGIRCLVTSEPDPERAVSLDLDGKPAGEPPRAHSYGQDHA